MLQYAQALMDDLKGRLANRVQLTTDGHRAYLSAVEDAFGVDIDYAMLVKIYGSAGGSGHRTSLQPRRVLRSRQGRRLREPRSGRVSQQATSSARILVYAHGTAPFHPPY